MSRAAKQTIVILEGDSSALPYTEEIYKFLYIFTSSLSFFPCFLFSGALNHKRSQLFRGWKDGINEALTYLRVKQRAKKQVMIDDMISIVACAAISIKSSCRTIVDLSTSGLYSKREPFY